MRVTEELDAMRVMGISHSYRLVMPRAMALAIAMPLISVWTTFAGLAGGMVAADLSLGITPQFFLNALPEAVAPWATWCWPREVGGVRHPDRADRLPLRPARGAQHPEPGAGHHRVGGDRDHGGDPGRRAVRHRSSATWASDAQGGRRHPAAAARRRAHGGDPQAVVGVQAARNAR
jgi:hypothetical protein